MSIYYYLYGGNPIEALCLGPRGRSLHHEYSGPALHLDKHVYSLPAQYLDLLIERFKAAYPGAEILDEGDFDIAMDAIGDPHVVYVGGNADDDIPLQKYLPEVDTGEFKRIVRADPGLLVR